LSNALRSFLISFSKSLGFSFSSFYTGKPTQKLVRGTELRVRGGSDLYSRFGALRFGRIALQVDHAMHTGLDQVRKEDRQSTTKHKKIK
jgi:hypothetical protein